MSNRFQRWLFFLGLVGMTASPHAASLFRGTMNLPTLRELLPGTQEMAPWVTSGEPLVYPPDRLAEYVAGRANLYLEYGFMRLLSQAYEAGSEAMVVDLFEMDDAEAAFGIYSLYRDPASAALDIGDDGLELDYQIAFWQDQYYVVISGNASDAEARTERARFARLISQRIGVHARPPELLHDLPPEHIVPRSQGLVLGWSAFSKRLYLQSQNVLAIDGRGAKAAFASYADRNDRAQLMMIHYQDENLARQYDRVVRGILARKYRRVRNTPFFKDGKGGFYGTRCRGPFLLIYYRASSQDFLRRLLSR